MQEKERANKIKAKKERIKKTRVLKKFNFHKFFIWIRKKSNLLKIRVVLVYTISIIVYWIAIYLLLIQGKILPSLLWVLIFFGLFHYVFLDFRHRGMKYIWIIFGLLSVLEIIIIDYYNREVIISILVFNMGIIVLALFLNSESTEKRIFKSWSYFTVWGYIFAVFTSIAYWLFLLWWNTTFKLDCNVLHSASENFVDYFAKPFKLWFSEVKDTKNKIGDFFESEVADFLHAGKVLSSQSSHTEIVTELPENNSLLQKARTQISWLQDKIDTMLNDSSVVNLWICEFLLSKIKERSNLPVFQFSMLVLVFFLVLPFVRIAMWVISIISFILFKILFRLKVYRIHKVKQEVEEII